MNLRRLSSWVLILFMVYLSIGCKQSASPPALKEIGPTKTKAGQAFNVQPDGESAIWTKTENATKTTIIVWGEGKLQTTYGSPQNLTALLPKELYNKPGRFQISLTDTKTGAKSNSLIFTVEE